MGLYLCLFDEDEELDGVEVGSYRDFAFFRDAVAKHLEGNQPGSRFATLMLHSDCDGSWSPEESRLLESELRKIADAFRELPPIELPAGWQADAAKSLGLKGECLYDCFFDVDGEPLIERLLGLAKLSQATGKPILFQ